MQEIISRGSWKVLEGDRDFDDPGIKIQKELYRLTPTDLKDKLVVDVGAYIGDSTRHYLDCGATVVAFEPFPDAFECLRHNCPEAILHCSAVGTGCESVNLFDHPDYAYPQHVTNWGTRRVVPDSIGLQTVPLDSLAWQAKIDVLKVDVEGFEWAVMEGARLVIKTHRPTIIVEVFDSALLKYGRGRSDVLRWIPERYTVKVGVGRYEDDRCDLLCQPIEVREEEVRETESDITVHSLGP